MPAGWQGVNQRDQVIMADPNGQGQIAFGSAKGATPDAAAQTFLSQQGMQNLGSQRVTVGGDQATVAQFAATTSDNQAVRGEVLFIQHAGAVYQFLGLTLSTSWPTLGPAISQSLRSFGSTATNQQFRQRKYLRVVTLPRATTVADLAAQSGGAIAVTQLATINAVAETSTWAAGSRVKTVSYR